MSLGEWGGVIGFVVALVGSILVCRWIFRHPPVYTDTSGDIEYDRLVMRSILPKGSGFPIEKVAEELKGKDLGEFRLDGYPTNTEE